MRKADFETELRRHLDGDQGRVRTRPRAIPLRTWARLGAGRSFTDRSTLGMPAHTRGIVIERPQISIPADVRSPASLRVLHLCDLHLRRRNAPVKRLIETISRLEYDLALLGGDYADNAAGRRRTIELMRHIHAPLGCFAIAGNHDRFRYNYPDTWRAKRLTRRGIPTRPGVRIPLTEFVEQMADVGVRFLSNERVRIALPEGDMWLLGVDDYASGFDDLPAAIGEVPDGVASIMLTHSPDILLDAAAAGVPLVLAGHTHGGQILFPKIGALIRRTAMPLNPPCGHFRIGDAQLYISRGAGQSFPLRINCPPEVTLIDLRLQPAFTINAASPHLPPAPAT